MATLIRWNGNSNCCCKYCTPGSDTGGFFLGEACDSCYKGVFEAHPTVSEWLVCNECGVEAREALSPLDIDLDLVEVEEINSFEPGESGDGEPESS